MARESKQLARSLRSRGIRKKVAGDIARALGRRPEPKSSLKSIADLTSAVREINDRLRGAEKRSAAAKKGARTRKRKVEKRSEAAKRGARKRARA